MRIPEKLTSVPILVQDVKIMNLNPKRIGSNFDDFLEAEGLRDQAEVTALKRVIAYQIAQEMKARHYSKSEMASRMQTSRAALNRLLDPENFSVTLQTLQRAAVVLNKKLKIEFA